MQMRLPADNLSLQHHLPDTSVRRAVEDMRHRTPLSHVPSNWLRRQQNTDLERRDSFPQKQEGKVPPTLACIATHQGVCRSHWLRALQQLD